ncbi:hypothetical protein [Anaeromicrobium sediminis]|uniref:Uncharacterized protein n=1 Tax=Anaeromicrobium sediminis TaxID=1478221 RepID=A0A267MP26_9FIRM|nr:hypothetical protein [Anaeromicrobium sediminis]PAB61354.1 hypothetical protein CCE28_02690 [Anaeromicrobium sediminis]
MNKYIFHTYLRNHKFLNLLLILALLLIIINGFAYNSPVWFDLDYIIVNYFIDILVNLSIGYIVSLIFYILVVFIPDTKKEYQLKAKYMTTFGVIGSKIHNFILTVFKAIEFEVMPTDDVHSKWKIFFEHTDLHYINHLRNKVNKFEDIRLGTNHYETYYDKLIILSSQIELLKKDLIPFIAFFTENETDVYTDIEDRVIFSNIRNFENDLCIGTDDMFSRDLLHLIDIYYKIRKLQGADPISFYNKIDQTGILQI